MSKVKADSLTQLEELKAEWLLAWPQAIADWSNYVQLREPAWCFTKQQEVRESLSGSFAMIRLKDHTVVISLIQVVEKGLEKFAAEILAHEIGHHVYCPADLTDNVRLLARIRRGLPGCESFAPMVANLYADLFINDRLQRQRGRDMAGVYKVLKPKEKSGNLWKLYMRTYELLWSLPPETLTDGVCGARLNQDALLASRLIRVYSRDWLSGAGRFACLLLPYVSEEGEACTNCFKGWCDTTQAGAGAIPDGLAEIEEDEIDGAIHPAEDPVLSGLDPIRIGEVSGAGYGRVPGHMSGRKSLKSFRDPFEYTELLKAAGVNLDPREVAIRYYRERAKPYLVPFPARTEKPATDAIPEGLGLWDIGDDISRVDWMNTLIASPDVIPGVTTKERLFGDAPGNEPEKTPLNLYLGVDCSGSMGDPAYQLSYPVLAGTVIALSALRAGAKVKVVLSGEPGRSISTEGFIRNSADILKTLLNYLGTGYSFGIHRLAETFSPEIKIDRPTHILIVSDYDMFAMLDEKGNNRLGWDVAKESVQHCGGGATYVLQLPGYNGDVKNEYSTKIERMKLDGWNVHLVNSMEELLTFSKQFSQLQYQLDKQERRGQHAS
ncbi:MAG: hypothetical protein U0930_06005 [Pirellulales bacterium]